MTMTNLPPTIYVDMDGVLTEFSEEVGRIFGYTLPDAQLPYDIWSFFGRTEDEMWAEVHKRGPEWWENLPAYPWARALWDGLRSVADCRGAQLVVCTSPDRDGHSAMGKMRWMNRWVGGYCRDIVLTPQKHLLARGNAVLVDDFDKNVDRFREHGGYAVTFPRQWNRSFHFLGDKAAFVVSEVDNALTCSTMADTYKRMG